MRVGDHERVGVLQRVQAQRPIEIGGFQFVRRRTSLLRRRGHDGVRTCARAGVALPSARHHVRIDLHVPSRHDAAPRSACRTAHGSRPVEPPRDRRRRPGFLVSTMKPVSAVIDDLGHASRRRKAMTGVPQRHRLDHHQAEGLGPVDGKQSAPRVAEELGLLARRRSRRGTRHAARRAGARSISLKYRRRPRRPWRRPSAGCRTRRAMRMARSSPSPARYGRGRRNSHPGGPAAAADERHRHAVIGRWRSSSGPAAGCAGCWRWRPAGTAGMRGTRRRIRRGRAGRAAW